MFSMILSGGRDSLSKTQIIVYGNCDLLLRAKIAFRSLD